MKDYEFEFTRLLDVKEEVDEAQVRLCNIGPADNVFTSCIYGKLYPWFSKNMLYALSYEVEDLPSGVFFADYGQEESEGVIEKEEIQTLKVKPVHITVSNFGDPYVTEVEGYKYFQKTSELSHFDKTKVSLIALDPESLEVFIKAPDWMGFRKLGEFSYLPDMDGVTYDYVSFDHEVNYRICLISTLIRVSKSWAVHIANDTLIKAVDAYTKGEKIEERFQDDGII